MASTARRAKLLSSAGSAGATEKGLRRAAQTSICTDKTAHANLAGLVFLDHARLALSQADTAKEAARRAVQPAKPTFALGCLTGKEIDWLPEAMRILHDELSNIEVTVSSQNSPDLADVLMRGRLDAAFMRLEERADDLVYKRVTTEPFVVMVPSDHRLAGHDAVDLRELVG